MRCERNGPKGLAQMDDIILIAPSMTGSKLQPEHLSRRLLLALPFGVSAAEPEPVLHLALSETLVGEVNINDARATMQIWIRIIAQEMKLKVETEAGIFDNTETILRKVRSGAVDSVAMNVVEYRHVAALLDPSQIVVQSDGGDQRYVLLCGVGNGVESLKDLRGKRLMLLNTTRMCVARAWLTTLLAEDKLEPAERYFATVMTEEKASKAILPVFFGKAEAAITTARAFHTMCELNPQVGKKVRILTTSPEVVTTFYAFRKGFRGPLRERVVAALSGLKNTTAGRQMMALFQFESLLVRDGSCLKPSVALLETAERAFKGRS